MPQEKKRQNLVVTLLQLLVSCAVIPTSVTLHSAFPIIVVLFVIGAFHLLRAFQIASSEQSNFHLWSVLACILSSVSVYFLLDRLLIRHDRWGHLGWLFLPVYFAALMRAEKIRVKPAAKPQMPDA